MKLCIWKCGRKTKKRSGICDPCWTAAEQIRSLSDEGYKAWCERKKAKQAKEPAIELSDTLMATFPLTGPFRKI